ncbi:MAG: hypothetical protein E6Q61_05430 [Nitrosomonas sp.]|nr:MAG: hypothetical protein E6Q61_05430 [Nitrosomonas sp.]
MPTSIVLEVILSISVFLILRSLWQRRHLYQPKPQVEIMERPHTPIPTSPEEEARIKAYFEQVKRLPIAQRYEEKGRA